MQVLASVLVRLFAIVLVMSVLGKVGEVIFFAASGLNAGAALIVGLVMILPPVLVAGFLWLRPGLVFANMVDKSLSTNSVDEQQLFRLGASLIGLAFVVLALVSLSGLVSQYYLFNLQNNTPLSGQMLVALISKGAQLLLGLGLILGSGGLWRVYWAIKRAGLPKGTGT